MKKQTTKTLNQLQEDLPEGLLVDAAWLRAKGYKTSAISKYVAAGRLEHPARRVYRKPRGKLTWEQVVISLQTLVYRSPLAVGGRTALELQGFSHYLRSTQQVHLYGQSIPGWLLKLPLSVRFVFHRSSLFTPQAGVAPKGSLEWPSKQMESDATRRGFRFQRAERSKSPLVVSSPERALLELLQELPNNESFEQVDKLVEGLSTLSPRRMQTLLQECKSVKVKRLFFYFADRHQNAWNKQIDKTMIDLGKGKRMLVKGGVLDQKYMITVPKGMDAV